MVSNQSALVQATFDGCHGSSIFLGEQAVGLVERRLRIDRSSPFLDSLPFEHTDFLTHSGARKSRKNCC